ncbi:methyltransferase domain-containing protein [Tistrella sp. BH-R2-4]|uniref:Methyltransferase domain-containing protein n=1 Tax=Tistrella arctica TaxID=3133430 RepID=A0ABU9YIR8_9PROT
MLSRRFDIAESAEPIVTLNEIQRRARQRLITDIEAGEYVFVPLPCPVCEGTDFTPLATRDRYGVPCRVVICKTCTLVQTNPYLDDNSVGKFYSEIFGPLHRGAEQPTEQKFRGRRQYGSRVASWLMKNGVTPPMQVVDVGCSSGGVLQGLTDAGFKGVGIDISPDYIADARSRGLTAIVGTLDDLVLPEPPDVIAYCQSLEHFVSINEELERISRVAGAKTQVYIEVPGLF